MKKENIEIGKKEAVGIYDSAQNIKDTYHLLLAAQALCEDDRDTYRDIFQKLFAVRRIVNDAADSLKRELASLIPGVDAICHQIHTPEEIEELKNKTSTFGDDWRYLKE